MQSYDQQNKNYKLFNTIASKF